MRRPASAAVAVTMAAALWLGCTDDGTEGPPVGSGGGAGSGGSAQGGSHAGGSTAGTGPGAGGVGGSPWVLPDDCLANIPSPLLLDTTSQCPDSTPAIRRALSFEPLLWGGIPHVLLNEGNELRFYDVQDPYAPLWLHSSNFNVSNQGDSDYDLMDAALCDECRYGAATFKTAKILFDLGTGSEPYPSDHHEHPGTDRLGSCTFSHQGQQYLVATGYADTCNSNVGTLYTLDGVLPADLTSLGCVGPGSSVDRVNGCFHIPTPTADYIYLGTSQGRLLIYELSGSGASLTLQYQDLGASTLQGALGRHKGVSLDLDASPPLLVSAVQGQVRLYDLTDPAQPALLSTTAVPYANLATLHYPLLWVAWRGTFHAYSFDVTDPGSPQPYQQDFWDLSHPWNSRPCQDEQDGQFSPDGSVLYLARYTIGQMVDLTACWP